MAAKTAAHDTIRKEGAYVAYPIKASAPKIWKGAPIFINSAGHAYANDGTTLTITNGDMFVGVSDDTVDNSAGAAGDNYVRVWAEGIVAMPIAATAAQTDVGQNVYVNNATDDALVTLTSDTGNPQVTVGKIVEILSTTSVYVALTGVYSVAANGA